MFELLNTRQVAAELGVHINAVYNYIHEGSLKAFKIGGYAKGRHWRVRREHLEAFINHAGQADTTGDTLKKVMGSSDRSSVLPSKLGD